MYTVDLTFIYDLKYDLIPNLVIYFKDLFKATN